MVKRIFKYILKLVIFIFVYLLQIYVVNNTTFFGVTGDLCFMAVVINALIESKCNAYVTAILSGITSDLLFSSVILKYTVIYIITIAVLLEFKKMYKQDSKIAVIIFSVSATVISEIIMFVFNIVTTGEFVNIFVYILNVFKQCIINICLAYLLCLALKVCKQEG